MAADGSIIIETEIDDKKAQQELNRLNKRIQTLNDQIYVKQKQKMPLIEQAQELGAQLDQAKAKLDEMQSGGSFYTSASIKEQSNVVNQLQKEWDGINNRIDRMDAGIQEATVKLNLAKEQAGEMQQRMASTGPVSERMAKAMDRMQKSANRFSLRLREVVRSALIFTTISRALAALRDWMSRVIKTNDEATKAIAKLKGALLTLAQPLVNIIVPAFTALVNALNRIITAVSRVVSTLFGTTIEESAEAAENLYNESEAIDSVGDSAKKAEKSLASFDEINQLSGGTSAGSASVATGGIAPDFSGIISDQLSAIVELFTGAALLALGAILTFSGAHILLGIGLMVLGAVSIWDAATTNWDAISTLLRGSLGLVVSIISGAILAVGAILAFSGSNIPLGIGMMIAGSIGLGAAVAANWNTIVGLLRGPIGIITAIVSGALLALGSILAFSGANIPLGIGIIAVGAIGMAAALSVNWNTIVTAMQGPVGQVTAIVSGALLALGAILLFTGANVALGLGMITAGGIGLVLSITPNWNFILDAISSAWNKFKSWWDGSVGKFFTLEYWENLGQQMLEGLMRGLTPKKEIIEERVKENLSSVVSTFEGIGQESANGIGTILNKEAGTVSKDFSNILSQKTRENLGIHSPSTVFMEIGQSLMDGLLLGIQNKVQPILDAFTTLWTNCYNIAHTNITAVISDINSLIDRLAAIERNITITITTVYRTVGSPSSGSGTTTSRTSSGRSISLQNIPALAQGAVIPPNREFLAVLGDQKRGTNIEAPLSTMIQAFRTALAEDRYSGGRVIENVIVLDGEVIYRNQKKVSNRHGASLTNR